MNMYSRLNESFLKSEHRERTREWRKGKTITRVERPTRLDRARALGYRAKQGYILARVMIRKGGRRRETIRKGRKPGKVGLVRFTPDLSKQAIAEKRVARQFMNLEVLNSYYAGEDGFYKYYEVILVDPSLSIIAKDKRINWILNHRNRVFRGLTSAARKSRGY